MAGVAVSAVSNAILMVKWFFTPDFWRRVLMRRVRVAVYLSSGAVVKGNVSHFKISVKKGQKSYDFGGLTEYMAFDVSEVVAFREVRWW